MTELWKEKVLDGMVDNYLLEAIKYEQSHNIKRTRIITAFEKMAACITGMIILLFSSLFVAVAAGNMTAYEVLYALYPDIAVKLMPVYASCEDEGIRMEVEGVSIQDNCAYIYISMQDVEGNRIDESIDLFDSYSIETNADQIGGCSYVDFDEKNQKASFLITLQNMDDKPVTGNKMTFRVSRFLTGKKELQKELTEICLEDVSSVTETQTEEGLQIRGGSYANEYVAEGMKKEYLCVDESKMFVPTPGVTVTNYGLINNRLHVQVYYEDILQFDNHGYIYVMDSDGNVILPENSTAFWDEEKKGSYEEYIFDINVDELEHNAVYGHFFTCQTLVEGEWEVRFTIEEQE